MSLQFQNRCVGRLMVARPSRHKGSSLMRAAEALLDGGANTNTLASWLEPLPYEQPGQLVNLWEMRPNGRPGGVSSGAFMDRREHSASFEGVSSVRGAAANLPGTGEPERINGLRASATFLSILREQPEIGRGFLPAANQP
jgi:hypothetical protein